MVVSALAQVAVLTAAALWITSDPGDGRPTRGVAFLRRVLHDGLVRGHGAGTWDGGALALPVRRLEPGDILVGANPDCVYGAWSHASIALGPDAVLGYHLLSGIYRAPVDEFAGYRRIRILRPRLPAETRLAAAAWAEGLMGGVFSLFALRDDPRRWTCAKAVWAAYARAGLDLAPDARWVTPADLATAPGLEVVWEAER